LNIRLSLPAWQRGADDVSQFDSRFTAQTPIDSPVDAKISESANLNFQGFTYVAPSVMEDLQRVESSLHKPRTAR